jgi:hypothetical protein
MPVNRDISEDALFDADEEEVTSEENPNEGALMIDVLLF